MPNKLFSSARLTYHPIEENDAWDQTLYGLRTSPSFWNGDTAIPTPGGKTTVKDYRDILAKHCTLPLYILLKDDTPDAADRKVEDLIAIGTLTLSKDGPDNHGHHGQASVGIEIVPEYMGKGYGSEALRWIQWYAFHVAKYHRVEIQCVTWNKGALRLYQKLGWKLEGVAREAIWFMGGWHGLATLGLLEHEWRAAREIDGFEASGEDMTNKIAKLMNCE